MGCKLFAEGLVKAYCGSPQPAIPVRHLDFICAQWYSDEVQMALASGIVQVLPPVYQNFEGCDGRLVARIRDLSWAPGEWGTCIKAKGGSPMILRNFVAWQRFPNFDKSSDYS